MTKPLVRLEKETLVYVKKLRGIDPVIKALSLPKLVNLLVVDGATSRISKQQRQVA